MKGINRVLENVTPIRPKPESHTSASFRNRVAAFAMSALAACGGRFDDANTHSYAEVANTELETREQGLTTSDLSVEARKLTNESITTGQLLGINVVEDGYLAYVRGLDYFTLVTHINNSGNIAPREPFRLSFLPTGASEPIQFHPRVVVNAEDRQFYRGLAEMGSVIMDNDNPDGMSAFSAPAIAGLGFPQKIVDGKLYFSTFAPEIISVELSRLDELAVPNVVTPIPETDYTVVDYTSLGLPSRYQMYVLGESEGEVVTLLAHKNSSDRFTGTMEIIIGETSPRKIILPMNFQTEVRRLLGNDTEVIMDISVVNHNSDELLISVLSRGGQPLTFKINIPETPEAPTGLSVVGVPTENTIGLTWTSVIGASSYIVRYRVSGTGEWQELTVGSNSTEITGLNPGTSYEIAVSAVNARGESDVSDSLNIRTAEAPIPLPETPVGFNAECTTDTCDFSWEMPIGIPERPESSPVALFAIKIRPVGGAWGDEIRQEETTMRLTDLPSNTEFEVEIYSVSADGFKSATPLMANFRTMAEVIIPDTGPDSTDVEELDAGDVTVDVPDTLDATDTFELDAADVLDTELDSTETPDVQQDIAQDANLDTSNDTGQDAAPDTSVDAGNDAGPDVEVSPDTDSGRPDVVVADAGVDTLTDTEIGVDSGSEQPREPRDPGGCSAARADTRGNLGGALGGVLALGLLMFRRREDGTIEAVYEDEKSS